jgi:alkanesulfonate monooxygenase SsuD/methylene tetrahydromethanopterin reductase-like flavin-dependent oxidoreductase (luciferase family)
MEVGRDPATISRSAQALVWLSDDEGWLAQRRAAPPMRPQVIGTVDEMREHIGAYMKAGVDEFIVPDFNLGRRRDDVLDRFIADVASEFRE